jgi:hypothetical protein
MVRNNASELKEEFVRSEIGALDIPLYVLFLDE